MRVKSLFRVVLFLALLPLVLLTAALAYIALADLNTYKPRIEQALGAASGRTVVLGGHLEFNLFPRPALALSDVRLANAPWGTQPDMLRVGRIEADFSLSALFKRKLVFTRLDLEDLEVYLERDAQDEGNWVMRPVVATPTLSPDEGRSWFEVPAPKAVNLHVRDLDINIKTGAGGTWNRLNLTTLRARSDSLDAPIRLKAKGRWNTQAFRIEGEALSMHGLLGGQARLPVDLMLSLDAWRLSLVGSIGDPAHAKDLDLRLRLAAPGQSHAVASVSVTGGGDALQLTDLAADVAGGTLSGSGRITREGARPRIHGELRLADLRFAPGAPAASAPVPDWSRYLEALHRVDVDVAVEAQAIHFDNIPISSLKGRVRLEQARLSLQEAQLETEAGRVAVGFSLDVAQTSPAWALSLRADGLDLKRLPDRMWESDALAGRLSGSLSLQARGTTPQALSHSLNGQGALHYRRGEEEVRLRLTRAPDAVDDAVPVELSGEGRWFGREFSLQGRVGPLRDVLSTLRPYPLDVVLTALDVQVRLNGRLSNILAERAVELDLIADSASLEVLGRALDLPLSGPAGLSARLTGTRAALWLRELRIAHRGVSVQGELGLLHEAVGPVAELALDVTHAAGTGRVEGRILSPRHDPVYQLALTGAVASLARLSPPLEQTLPDTGPLEFRADLRGRGVAPELRDLRLEGLGGTLNADVVFALDGPRPALSAQLILEKLDLRGMPSEPLTRKKASQGELDEGIEDAPLDGKEEDAPRLFSTRALPLDLVRGVDLRLGWRAADIKFAHTDLIEARGDIEIQSGVLTLNLTDIDFTRTDFTGRLIVDARAKPAQYALQIQAPHIDLTQALSRTRVAGALEGNLAAVVSLTAEGESQAAIMGSLDGQVNFVMRDGTARDLPLDAGVAVFRALLSTVLRTGDNFTPINCAIADVSFTDGLARTGLVLVDTRNSRVVAKGTLDFSEERINLKVTPAPKRAALSIAAPVIVTGSFAQPRYHLDPAGGVLKLGELMTLVAFPEVLLLNLTNVAGSKENPCVTLVAPTQTGGTLGAAKRLGRAAGGAIKNVGQGIGRVFTGHGESDESVSGEGKPGEAVPDESGKRPEEQAP